MRVVAGHLGGRVFQSPSGHRTHPMSEKARGALFNTLSDVAELTVLDAFAGSGALGFEALSRGASHVTFIEVERLAQQAITQNISQLDLGSQTKLIKASTGAWLSTTDELFDIVLCDPPFDEPQLSLLTKLAARAKPSGLVIISLPPTLAFSLPSNEFQHLDTKNYGDNELLFFRKLPAD